MAWSLDLDEIEQYRHDGCLLVQSVLADEDLRLLDEAVREVTEAAIGSHNQDELIDVTVSLYDIQAGNGSRETGRSPRD